MNKSVEMNAAVEELTALMGGFWHTAVIHALAKLDVAEAFADKQRSCADVAAEIEVDASSLFRLMRAAAALGLAAHHDDDCFSFTQAGRYLRGDVPGSVKGRAMHVGGELYRAFGDLAQSVESGAPPGWIKHGPAGFAALNEDPQTAAIFNQAMVDGSRSVALKAAEVYDFGRFKRIMDVGGGYGAVLAVLLQNNPNQTGVILDLAHCADGAAAYLKAQGVAGRARFVTGSFFESVPAEADCYILKYIVHDWSDDYARTLLGNCSAAAKASDGVVVLIERIVPERIGAEQQHGSVVMSDLTMMLWAGKERTEAEFRSLLKEAGLKLSDLFHIDDTFYVIEAVPL